MRNVLSILMLPIGVMLLVGAIFLQIFLSKKENKWLGLILPTITFLYSLITIFSIAIFPNMTAGGIFTLIATVFILCNIPTIIFLCIYFGCRKKFKARSQLDKMNIQDLE